MNSDNEFVTKENGLRFCIKCNGLDPRDAIFMLEEGWQVYVDPFEKRILHIAGPLPPLEWKVMQNETLFVPVFQYSYEMSIEEASLEQMQKMYEAVKWREHKN